MMGAVRVIVTNDKPLTPPQENGLAVTILVMGFDTNLWQTIDLQKHQSSLIFYFFSHPVSYFSFVFLLLRMFCRSIPEFVISFAH